MRADEFEAIYQADHLGKTQKSAAVSMHISQQTFSRILQRARKTIADSLVTGKIIRIQEGVQEIDPNQIPVSLSKNPGKSK